MKSGLEKDRQMCLHPFQKITFHYKAPCLLWFHLELSVKYFEMELHAQTLSPVPNLKSY